MSVYEMTYHTVYATTGKGFTLLSGVIHYAEKTSFSSPGGPILDVCLEVGESLIFALASNLNWIYWRRKTSDSFTYQTEEKLEATSLVFSAPFSITGLSIHLGSSL